jgi:aryl-phospho-beta-D-glucosidase BglC (GH1 family)
MLFRPFVPFAVILAGALAASIPKPAAQTTGAPPQPRWLPATAQHLPRWRGFNLTDKFYLHRGPSAFQEEDFRLISQLGFNFVRLPMDYRFWIKNGDWNQFDEDALKDIDQAVAWGGRYGIHVCINFHRAPGYTVAKPPEPKSLWTDPEAQRVCAMHWARFARHYKGIPSERLSFNLFNEPPQIDPKIYVAVCKQMVDAIHAEDPDRLVIADGLAWGGVPVPELRELGIAEATRGYFPMNVSHYKADWIKGQNQVTPPIWPAPLATGFLAGPWKQKQGMTGTLVIDGTFTDPGQLRLHVDTVSTSAQLVVQADGKPVWNHAFQCGPGAGEWKEAVLSPKWKTYQNVYDRNYFAPIPAGARELRVSVTSGDWLRLSEFGIATSASGAATHEDALALNSGTGCTADPIVYNPAASPPFSSATMEDRDWLWRTRIEPWKALEASGVGVIVGEWGVYNHTPHDVALRWMEDCLQNWQRAGWGWALWNFRGSFGVMDSARADVKYEDFQGHKLDRQMLDLLQRY